MFNLREKNFYLIFGNRVLKDIIYMWYIFMYKIYFKKKLTYFSKSLSLYRLKKKNYEYNFC